MRYVDPEDQKAWREREQRNLELSGKIVSQHSEYFRNRSREHREAAARLTDAEKIRRDKEQSEALEKRKEQLYGPRLYSKPNIRTGQTEYWTIDTDGNRKDYDREKDRWVSQPSQEETPLVLLAMFSFAGLAFGLGVVIEAFLGRVQSLLLIWGMAIALVGLLVYAYKRWNQWLADKGLLKGWGDLTVCIAVIVCFAILVTWGWLAASM